MLYGDVLWQMFFSSARAITVRGTSFIQVIPQVTKTSGLRIMGDIVEKV
jgi:hypothetical protein